MESVKKILQSVVCLLLILSKVHIFHFPLHFRHFIRWFFYSEPCALNYWSTHYRLLLLLTQFSFNPSGSFNCSKALQEKLSRSSKGLMSDLYSHSFLENLELYYYIAVSKVSNYFWEMQLMVTRGFCQQYEDHFSVLSMLIRCCSFSIWIWRSQSYRCDVSIRQPFFNLSHLFSSSLVFCSVDPLLTNCEIDSISFLRVEDLKMTRTGES